MKTRSLLLILMITVAGSVTDLRAQFDNEVDWGVHPIDYSRVGTSGWQFLKLPTHARSASMAGIRSALGYGDASAVFGNPASAADVAGTDVQFSSMEWVADIQFNSVGIVQDLAGWGTIGISFQYIDYGDMVRTQVGQSYDDFGNDLGIIPITSGLGTFTAHDLALGFVYARQVTDNLQLGGSVKVLEEQLDDARTRNWGIDVGTLYWTGLGSLRISMLGRNFGPDAEFSSYDEQIKRTPIKVRMPMMFILGAAYDVLEASIESPHRLTVAAEYVKPNDGPQKYHIGAEAFLFYNISLRCGYRFNYDEESFTFGIGAEYSLADVLLQVDYAYAEVGRFNNVSMLSVGIGL